MPEPFRAEGLGLRWWAWLMAVAVLVLTFLAYFHPNLALDLANQFWLCVA